MENLQFKKVGNNSSSREYVRILRNYYKDYFINNQEIDLETHENFMNLHSEHYYLLTKEVPPYDINNLDKTNELLIGFIGVVDGDVRLAVHPLFLKQGYGKKMLEFITKEYPNCHSKVKKDNASNLFLFERSEDFIEYNECNDYFYFKSKWSDK